MRTAASTRPTYALPFHDRYALRYRIGNHNRRTGRLGSGVRQRNRIQIPNPCAVHPKVRRLRDKRDLPRRTWRSRAKRYRRHDKRYEEQHERRHQKKRPAPERYRRGRSHCHLLRPLPVVALVFFAPPRFTLVHLPRLDLLFFAHLLAFLDFVVPFTAGRGASARFSPANWLALPAVRSDGPEVAAP